MHDTDAIEISAALFTCTLPKPEWTHDAHLAACWATLRTMPADEALDHLRRAIRTYNVSTGVQNTADSGYHETITRYYIGAVASLGDRSVADVIGAERCERSAPLTHWSSERLFSVEARADWLEPDLAALPWETPGAT